MDLRFKHIILYLALSAALAVSCRNDGPRVIEDDEMSQIYAEMLMTDQWINSTPGVRTIADTSLVYEPILVKYGYTSDDYRHSVSYYLDEPELLAEIMEETVKILDKRLDALKKEKDRQVKEADWEKYVKSITPDRKIREVMLHDKDARDFTTLSPEDSLVVSWDSTAHFYRMDIVAVADSLALADSLVVADSLAVADSLVTADTLLKPDTLAPALPKGTFVPRKLQSADRLIKVK